MGIRTSYTLKRTNKEAALLQTDNRAYAYSELQKQILNARPGEFFKIISHVEAVEPLTSDEKYVLLVYEVRNRIKQYFNGGRHHDDLVASLEKEKELELWNEKTKKWLADNPEIAKKKEQEQSEAYKFFTIVNKWQFTWQNYHSYRKEPKPKKKLLDELKDECFYFEKMIDDYIHKALKL
jgi:hypothetical protein